MKVLGFLFWFCLLRDLLLNVDLLLDLHLGNLCDCNLWHRSNLDVVVPVAVIVPDLRLIISADPLVIDDKLVLIASRCRHCNLKFELTISDSLHWELFPLTESSSNVDVVAASMPDERMVRLDRFLCDWLHKGLNRILRHLLGLLSNWLARQCKVVWFDFCV